MKNKKGILQCLMICVFCFLLTFNVGVFQTFAAAGDEIRASKKIISVVYDDSGSMIGNRWSYTNYAMQALIAMLNEQDELYITFMSQPDKSVAMNTSDLPDAIKTIREWSNSSGTPGTALDTARKKLGEIKESDATAQFWMVIFTDGAIAMPVNIQDKLNSYKNNTMSNGSLMNVVYLAIGDGANTASGDPGQHLHTFDAQTNDEIVQALQKIAALVSGRLSPDSTKQLDDKTISVTSKLPLYSLSILSQKSNASVVKANTQEEDLNIQRNLAVDATNIYPKGVPIDTLFGNVAVINNEDSNGNLKVIPAGTYTIIFSSTVDIGNMTIQVEPAVALKAEIGRNGAIIDDFSKLVAGDTVDITIIPVVPGTDTVIPDSDLPKRISWKIEYEVDGSVRDSGNGATLKGLSLVGGANVIRGTMIIPGYAPFVYEIPFTVQNPPLFGIEVERPDDTNYKRTDLTSFGEPKLGDDRLIRFRITDNGKVLSKDDLQAFDVTLIIDNVSVTPFEKKGLLSFLEGKSVSCKLTQNDDGSFFLIPHSFAPVLMLKTGDYNVTVSVSGDPSVTASASFAVVSSTDDIIDTVKWIITVVAVIYLLYLLFIKHKFKGQTLHYECWKIQEDGHGVLQKGASDSRTLGFFSGGFLLPTRACSVTYHGLTLIAGTDGSVTITGKSIAASVEKYGTSAVNPERRLKSIEAHLIKTLKRNGNKEKREASDQSLTSNPIYFTSSADTIDVWRIWMTD